MLVPETSMNENHRSVPGQHKIRGSRKVAPVEPKPVAKSMDESPNLDLRRGVGRLYLRHHGAALGPGELLGQNPMLPSVFADRLAGQLFEPDSRESLQATRLGQQRSPQAHGGAPFTDHLCQIGDRACPSGNPHVGVLPILV